MNCERSLIAAVVFLGLGIGLILNYCHDSTISFSAAHPSPAASLQFVIYTNGWPAMVGVAATVVGLLLLFVALTFAILAHITPHPVAYQEVTPAAEGREV